MHIHRSSSTKSITTGKHKQGFCREENIYQNGNSFIRGGKASGLLEVKWTK